MLGHLVPCGGGQAVALSKPRLVLRLKREAGAYPAAPDVELRFLEGWWHVRKIDSGCLLEVNGNASAACRLKPNDVLNIAGKFYRITFNAQTGAASVVNSLAGVITDTYWRFVFTISGTTPSFAFIAAAGIR